LENKNFHFYAVIIGTEILNGRREDKHFKFLKEELAKYDHELFASFVLKDDATLMKNIYTLIKDDPKGVLFSFGGIGSTPDDLTREVASEVFTNQPPLTHPQFKKDIIERFEEEAYPHRIFMADIPVGSKLLHNPINNMSGFSLEDRYFFTPGFPSMAHPMVKDVIATYFYHNAEKKHRLTLLAQTSENTLISLMQQLPKEIELSSLPMFIDNNPHVELSLASQEKQLLQKEFDKFIQMLQTSQILYKIL